jgi:hypothetical protein
VRLGGRWLVPVISDKIPEMPRLRTLAILAAVVVMTDVTWDGTSLRLSLGWPGRKPIASFVFP